jgi:hypothetical protein
VGGLPDVGQDDVDVTDGGDARADARSLADLSMALADLNRRIGEHLDHLHRRNGNGGLAVSMFRWRDIAEYEVDEQP